MGFEGSAGVGGGGGCKHVECSWNLAYCVNRCTGVHDGTVFLFVCLNVIPLLLSPMSIC